MGKITGRNIFLIGFSATGKSDVGAKVARNLGREILDTDAEIVKLTGKNISQIFKQEGEGAFRRIEREVLEKACKRDSIVIVTGGGTILDPENRGLMKSNGFVVCLEAEVETIHNRLLKDNFSSGPVRPLLDVVDPLKHINEMKGQRQSYYAIADWTVHTDNLTSEEVCHEVMRGWHYFKRNQSRNAGYQQKDLACEVLTSNAHYPVFIGWEILNSLGVRARQMGLSGVINILSDETVFFIYGDRVRNSFEEAGYTVNSCTIPSGELTKTMDTATGIFDWLVKNRAERGDIIVALGGGMVGDLAGFVAATFLRGLPLIQVSTSLLGMVDAAIGGKTAVNHPRAKNIIGSFYQPCMVLDDVQTLTTLSHRELTSGWAEVVKCGAILDAEYFEFLEKNTAGLVKLEPDIAIRAISRCAALKAQIVTEDEKEKGNRILLNYGHTIAHGLEAATDYKRFLHGEAVTIGILGAAMLSHELGLLPLDEVDRQRVLLERFGLSTRCSGINLEAVLKAMQLDKKVRGKKIRWVLLTGIGQPVIREDVPHDSVLKVLKKLLATS